MVKSGTILLDISRLVSRLPRATLTGVDRVERAYLRFVLNRSGRVFGLLRSPTGFLLLDRDGLSSLEARLEGRHTWPEPHWIDVRAMRARPGKAKVLAHFRSLAVDRCSRLGLKRLLARNRLSNGDYFNVGHSNLTNRVLSGCRAAGLRVHVLIHDTLPLDVPQFMRADTIPRFQKRMNAVAKHADCVIHPNETTKRTTEAQLAKLGRVPSGLVSPLGVDVPDPDLSGLPDYLGSLEGVFLTVGTIEPRKNHGLLLDLWEALARDETINSLPTLVLAGSRGWHDRAFFERLEASPLYGKSIFEAPNLDDRALAALYQKATALLFPSHAEGTGLPPLEAATLGCSIIAADLPVYRETLGSLPVYLSPVDMYPWLQIIKENLAGSRALAPIPAFSPPKWDAHFKTVFPDGVSSQAFPSVTETETKGTGA